MRIKSLNLVKFHCIISKAENFILQMKGIIMIDLKFLRSSIAVKLSSNSVLILLLNCLPLWILLLKPWSALHGISRYCSAKSIELYLKSDCSHFLMCTYHYSSYLEYKQLGVSKTQENIWRNEKLRMLQIEARKTGDLYKKQTPSCYFWMWLN